MPVALQLTVLGTFFWTKRRSQLELRVLLREFYVGGKCVFVCRTDTVMCRGAEERQETQLFRGHRHCACISKHVRSFLHCMHI